VWNGQEWEFESGGKKIVPESRDKLKVWASQGFNYSQRMGLLNKEHETRLAAVAQAEAKAQEEAKRYSPYREVDEYAQQNKEWWEHVQKSYQEREQPKLDPALNQVLAPLQEKLGWLEQTIKEREAEAQQAKAAQESLQLEERQREEDQTLDQEIQAIRKQHPNIDLSSTDPVSGETLEHRILKHCQDNGIKSFKAGYRDYLHDQLIEEAKTNGRTQIAKDKVEAARKGILGKTPAPTKILSPVNTKASWHSAEFDANNILKELGMGG
jgi:hypothetical protein